MVTMLLVLCYVSSVLDVSPVLWVPRQQLFLEADRSEDRGDKVFTI